MGYTYYQVEALIPSQTNLDFATVVESLRAKFSRQIPPPQIEHMGKKCLLRRSDWTFHLYWEDDPSFLEESAEYLAGRAAAQGIDVSIIATCTRRIGTWGDPDPDMLYFNDYVFVLEVLESFDGIYLFDPYDGKFIIE